jgi:large subunit ribosomal protein L21
MFAIIETGGKQFRVEEGNEFRVDRMDAEQGSQVDLDKVLLVNDGSNVTVGQPYVENAKVTCEVVGHGKDKKIIVFKKKRRNDYQKKQGHRQPFTSLKVKSISS